MVGILKAEMKRVWRARAACFFLLVYGAVGFLYYGASGPWVCTVGPGGETEGFIPNPNWGGASNQIELGGSIGVASTAHSLFAPLIAIAFCAWFFGTNASARQALVSLARGEKREVVIAARALAAGIWTSSAFAIYSILLFALFGMGRWDQVPALALPFLNRLVIEVLLVFSFTGICAAIFSQTGGNEYVVGLLVFASYTTFVLKFYVADMVLPSHIVYLMLASSPMWPSGLAIQAVAYSIISALAVMCICFVVCRIRQRR